MADKKKTATAASVAVAGLIVAAGATAAITASAETPTPTNGGSYGYGAPAGYGHQDGGRQGGQQDTAASATETAQVKAAMQAKDSSVTVQRVMKDPDGSFDVFGTKNGSQVMFDVSKDLKTITQNTRQGGHGGQHGTPASTTETAQVKAAIKAKDSTITVQGVMKDSDGSFDAFGTKSTTGASGTTGTTRVHIEVSKDLKTVTVETAPQRDGNRQQGQAPAPSGTQTPA